MTTLVEAVYLEILRIAYVRGWPAVLTMLAVGGLIAFGAWRLRNAPEPRVAHTATPGRKVA